MIVLSVLRISLQPALTCYIYCSLNHITVLTLKVHITNVTHCMVHFDLESFVIYMQLSWEKSMLKGLLTCRHLMYKI